MCLPGRLMYERLLAGLILSLLGASACGDDVATTSATSTNNSGTTTTGTTTTGTTTTTSIPTTTIPTSTDATTFVTSGGGSGGGETGIFPDPVACEPKECTEAKHCCDIQDHPSNNCPGPYPNNWTCVDSLCRQGGCFAPADCFIPGFTCVEVLDDNIKRCVAPCSSDAECIDAYNMPHTQCIGAGVGTSFCKENILSP